MQGGVLAAILTGSLVPVSLDDGTGGSSRMNSEVQDYSFCPDSTKYCKTVRTVLHKAAQ